MCKYKNKCANACDPCTSVRALSKEDMGCFKPACLTCGEPSEWDECIYCLQAREYTTYTRGKTKVPSFQ